MQLHLLLKMFGQNCLDLGMGVSRKISRWSNKKRPKNSTIKPLPEGRGPTKKDRKIALLSLFREGGSNKKKTEK